MSNHPNRTMRFARYPVEQYRFVGNQLACLPDGTVEIIVAHGGHQRYPASLRAEHTGSGLRVIRIGSTTYERTVLAVVPADANHPPGSFQR